MRRVSIKAARLLVQEKYKYADLSAATLNGAIPGDHDIPRDIRAFEDLAGNGVRSMNRLADLANTPDADSIWAEAATVARYQGQDAHSVRDQLVGLLKQHNEEWHQFLSEFGSGAWITDTVRGQHGN